MRAKETSISWVMDGKEKMGGRQKEKNMRGRQPKKSETCPRKHCNVVTLPGASLAASLLPFL